MSLYLETSTLFNAPAWPPDCQAFACLIDSTQADTPWLAQCKRVDCLQIFDAEWFIFSEFFLMRIPATHAQRCADHLWLFNAEHAATTADKMPAIEAPLQRRIETRCRKEKDWESQAIIASTIALRNQVQAWLRALPQATYGILRLYDWGKY